MKWTPDAEKALARVPFFVRKRVRKRVEEEAERHGSPQVHLDHVRACQKRYLNNMEAEVKGYQVEICFGPGGCPNRAAPDGDLVQILDDLLSERRLRDFLLERVKGPLKLHHEFRIAVADCTNACSRPQIFDIGIIGARQPRISGESCIHCGSCKEVCEEEAIEIQRDANGPRFHPMKCLSCGKCIDVCPTATIQDSKHGYRILLGGKLGRHPQLARELEGIFTADEVLDVVTRSLDIYFQRNLRGERLGEILNRIGWTIPGLNFNH